MHGLRVSAGINQGAVTLCLFRATQNWDFCISSLHTAQSQGRASCGAKQKIML